MRIVAMIPIKLNSERVKEKNIRLFYDGKPLIRFIIDALRDSKYITEIIVYCSDERIKKYIPERVSFLKRPSYLDANNCNCNDIIREFIKVVDADYYAVCHATAPFTSTQSIDKCVEAVVKTDKFDSAFTVEKMQTFLWSDGKPLNFSVNHFPRTQDLIPIYKETSGAFVFPKWVFEKYDRRIGETPCLVEVNPFEGLDIDSEYDMRFAQLLYKDMKEMNFNF